VIAAESQVQVRIIVTGRVQGVFFRASAADQARILGISGYARNLNNGSVEIVAEGERARLERMIAWSHHGPSHARVDGLRLEWGCATGEFRGFAAR
jgi:acylphosphatase